MNDSWSLEEIFNSVSDDIFNDAIKCFDFPLEDLEPNNVSGEEWDAGFQIIEPPPPNVLAGLSSGLLHGDCLSDDSDKRVSVSPDKASQLNLDACISEAHSCRSILLPGNNVDAKYSALFQTSSPVSVLEGSSSCPAKNPTPLYLNLNFPVKKGARSNKRRPASALNLQFLLPPIHASSSASRESYFVGAFELESETHAEKPAKEKRKKKRHLTLLSSADESTESLSEQQVAVRKCMHCQVTKTPQWREGPMGPKTLCNACGVRYRSGRLLPEYRPAASPTFVPSIHSNSHKKVIELRKKAKLQPHMGFTETLLSPTPCNAA